MENYLTTDISKMDLSEVTEMLNAYQQENTTPAFKAMWYDDETIPTMNQESGYTFLTNSDFQVAMIEPSTKKLCMFINCGECGKEDLERDWLSINQFELKCEGCKEVVKQLRECEK
tara:strand:+ start:212 stop:559 length:348 start_codon:yes stop_codon:yes gene_type:complete